MISIALSISPEIKSTAATIKIQTEIILLRRLSFFHVCHKTDKPKLKIDKTANHKLNHLTDSILLILFMTTIITQSFFLNKNRLSYNIQHDRRKKNLGINS